MEKPSLHVILVLQSEANLAKLEQNFEVREELDHFRSSAWLRDCRKKCTLDTCNVLVDCISNSLDRLLLKDGGVALSDLRWKSGFILEELGPFNSISSVVLSKDYLTNLVKDLSGSWASSARTSSHYFLNKFDGILITVLELLSQLLFHSSQQNLNVSDLIFVFSLVLNDFRCFFRIFLKSVFWKVLLGFNLYKTSKGKLEKARRNGRQIWNQKRRKQNDQLLRYLPKWRQYAILGKLTAAAC